MSSKLTEEPTDNHLNFCYLGGVVRNSSFTLNVVTISTSVVLAVLSPVAVGGNILIMVVIWRNQTLRTPSYILLSGLAFTDFCTGLITPPLFVASRLICFESSQETITPASHHSFIFKLFQLLKCFNNTTDNTYVYRKMAAHDSTITPNCAP